MEARRRAAALAALAAVVLLSGCSAARRRVERYENLDLTVIHASPRVVEENCRHKGLHREDDGTYTGNGALAAADQHGLTRYTPTKHPGCWKPGPREIWLSWDAGVDVVLHELRHADESTPLGGLRESRSAAIIAASSED